MRQQGVTQTEDLKTARKLLKPQVEKQRRERMNRSLETLRVLLLQETHNQGKSNRRIEKAEILEQTVIFLKKSNETGTSKAGEQQHIRDGFSACLQRAARFLHCRGEGPQVQTVLTTKFFPWPLRGPLSAHSPQTESAELPAQTCNSKSDCRQQFHVTFRNSDAVSNRRPLGCGDPSIQQRPQRDALLSCQSPPNKISQVVWRPWP